MPLIQLQHDRRLRFPKPGLLPVLPAAILAEAAGRRVVSFRDVPGTQADVTRRAGLHACTRFLDLASDDVLLYGVGTDSPLAPLIFWDVAHAMPVGGRLGVAGVAREAQYLQRSYYRDAFEQVSSDGKRVELRKIAPLAAERDRGLDRWTFGIPVGPEDATGLNAIVRRILEIDVPEKEILLCGRPGANFAYFDRVRIVGEDITAPPVQICKKKNRLAQEASFENLCILHDRVFLPSNFGEAVRGFGDLYPFATFQSLFFDDKWNLVPRRYSDYNRRERPLNQALGFTRDGDGQLGGVPPAALELVENAHFLAANPLNYHPGNYPTGSMYICKRSVWNAAPQDEMLFWSEFEDVEQGVRASDMGIPSRIVPGAITQSVFARPLLSFAGRVHYESADRRHRQWRVATETWPVPRKPLLKLSEEDAMARLETFARKYVPASELPRILPPLGGVARSSAARTQVIARVLAHARVAFDARAITQFVDDFERYVIIDQLPYGDKRFFVQQLYSRHSLNKLLLLELNHWYRNQVAQRAGQGLFFRDIRDYFPKRGWRTAIGTMISAFLLSRLNGKLLFLDGGFRAYRKAILASTPWLDTPGDGA